MLMTSPSAETTGIEFPPQNKLVTTAWLVDHLGHPNLVLVESNEDPLLFPSGHIAGAQEVDWARDLNDPLRRDYLDQAGFQALMRRLGATEDSFIVFYGDKSNWWAAYALWVFELFGVTNTALLDGGRLKWTQEGHKMTRELVTREESNFIARPRNDREIRAFREEVLTHVANQLPLVDVRSPDEFTGTKLHMEGYPNEGALRGGHIPGAQNVPWAKAVDPKSGTFLPVDSLQSLYQSQLGLSTEDDVITYCRIGERSSHTWFALKYLLGFKKVRNYDGSWTEYGNLVGVPIER